MDPYYEETLVDSSEEYEDPHCNGCLQPIEDGSVVQFGEGIWHFECFRCAKCRKLVECYSNHLLLRDGSPVCEDCSYSCHSCHKTIKDEAIMTGDEAYHAECFRCDQCHVKIEDLIFTQTSKGIFCTSCHEMRKQLRQKRKEDRLHRNHSLSRNTSLESDTRRPKAQPATSMNSTPRTHDLAESKNGVSALTFQELADLNNMLSKVLDSGIGEESSPERKSMDTIPSPPQTRSNGSPSTRNQLNQTENLGTDGDSMQLPPPSLNMPPRRDYGTREVEAMRQELEATKARLRDVENKFSSVKTMSRKALGEFNAVKEGFSAEMVARKEAEELVLKLQRELSFYQQANTMRAGQFVEISKEEVGQLSQSKMQLEQACDDLRNQRTQLLTELGTISHTIQENSASQNAENQKDRLQNSYHQQLGSTRKDIDDMRAGYGKLVKARNDIIAEMIMINTKNAHLTSLNNDLSRRVTEREREAIAVMAGTNFLTTDPNAEKAKVSNESEKVAPEIITRQLAQRDSFSATEAPRLFKFRRNKGNKSKAKEKDALISIPYDPNPGRPMETITESLKQPTKDSSDLVYHRVGGHNFLQTKYMRPVKCEACNEKMWRVSELKCQDCGVVSHSKCVYNVNLACNRKTSSDSKSESDGVQKVVIFGTELVKQIQSEKATIPLVVLKCIAAVEMRGMDYEGIYRKSGGAGQMRLIMQAFEQNDIPNLLDDERWNDICAVTSVLKQYFRELPNPLFTFEHHTKFMEAIMLSNSAEQLKMFGNAIKSLPTEHYNTLKCLMLHLSNVRKRSNENLMTSKNLAVIFGPTLMRHQDEKRDLVEMNYKIGAIEFILNNIDTLFTEPTPDSLQSNRSTPLPTSRPNLPVTSSAVRHRREASCDNLIRSFPPAVPPRKNAGYI
ncbi:hypothetical protein CLU79DRAFT_781284 [Phycomyces nitens]|nr:hypothetical protein CLU79DRAFT_781284 [Phycomyces nitens]